VENLKKYLESLGWLCIFRVKA